MKERKLIGLYGNLICELTRDECISMQNEGKIRKIGRTTYRLITPPEPSKSPDSSPMLTRSDMAAMAGLITMNPTRKERLIGWGLLPA